MPVLDRPYSEQRAGVTEPDWYFSTISRMVSGSSRRRRLRETGALLSAATGASAAESANFLRSAALGGRRLELFEWLRTAAYQTSHTRTNDLEIVV